jgi:hypothetical protein
MDCLVKSARKATKDDYFILAKVVRGKLEEKGKEKKKK